jgi:plastocyanin
MRKHLVTLLVVLALAMAACGGDDDGADGGADAGDDAGSSAEGGIDVTASGFAFEPNTLTATAGETTSVTFTNEDAEAHTFTIEELDVDLSAAGGETVEGELSADAGAYEFVCRIHPSMTGTLTVS